MLTTVSQDRASLQLSVLNSCPSTWLVSLLYGPSMDCVETTTSWEFHHCCMFIGCRETCIIPLPSSGLLLQPSWHIALFRSANTACYLWMAVRALRPLQAVTSWPVWLCSLSMGYTESGVGHIDATSYLFTGCCIAMTVSSRHLSHLTVQMELQFLILQNPASDFCVRVLLISNYLLLSYSHIICNPIPHPLETVMAQSI
jgi:hypothetical protein